MDAMQPYEIIPETKLSTRTCVFIWLAMAGLGWGMAIGAILALS